MSYQQHNATTRQDEKNFNKTRPEKFEIFRAVSLRKMFDHDLQGGGNPCTINTKRRRDNNKRLFIVSWPKSFEKNGKTSSQQMVLQRCFVRVF
jgi:hypothetical protein